MTAIGIWIIFLVSSVYAPFYDEYVSGCTNINSNGTFFTNNIYSVAYNYAAQDGSKSVVDGLHNLDAIRGQTCSVHRTKSVDQYQEDAVKLNSLRRSNDETIENMKLFEKCLDIVKMDSKFQDVCCDESGYDKCSTNNTNSEQCPWNDFVSPSTPYLPPGQ